MSSTYNGSSAGITPHQSVSVTNPSDGDALTATSNNVAIQTLANILQFLQERALLGQNYTNLATGSDPGGKFAGATGPSGGPGIDATGGGSSAGVVGRGGGGGGRGGHFTGTQGGGGSGASEGIYAKGADGSGGMGGMPGGVFDGGTNNGRGIEAFGKANGVAVYAESETAAALHAKRGAATDQLSTSAYLENGHLLFGGSAPAYNDAVPVKALHHALFLKGFGVLSWANGAPTIVTSKTQNLDSVSSPANGQIDLTLKNVPTQYMVMASAGVGAWVCRVNPVAFPGRILVQDAAGTGVDFSVTSGYVVFAVFGF